MVPCRQSYANRLKLGLPGEGAFAVGPRVGLAYPSLRRSVPELHLQFVGAHILSVDQFDRGDIERIFSVADDLRPYAMRTRVTRVLQGAILSNMFFEPSTRTRISFGSAFNLLGGEVRETTEVKASSLAKGESLHDTARVLSGYSDVIVMRHPQAGSVADFARASRVPVLNAGDGPNEHPSQALLDLYTIKQEMAGHGKGIDGLRIALIGDLKYGRAVHSLCKLLGHYDDIAYHPRFAARTGNPTRTLPGNWPPRGIACSPSISSRPAFTTSTFSTSPVPRKSDFPTGRKRTATGACSG